MYVNSVHVKDENNSVTLQQLPEENLLQRKKQMRLLHEERRREKKKSSKEAEIEESKRKLRDAMSEYQRLDSIQSLLEEELKASEPPTSNDKNELEVEPTKSITDYAYFVSKLAQQDPLEQSSARSAVSEVFHS